MLSLNPAFSISIAVILLIISYVIGSIPFGLIVGKLACHKDIRQYGSKNIGSTNAIRVLGKKIGFLVFFLDVLKGMIVIIIARVLTSTGVWISPIDFVFYGVAAVAGHSFSIFLNFKGGKAVATSLGVVIITVPLAAIMCLIVFLIVLLISGYVSLASTAAAITVITVTWVLFAWGLPSVTNFFEFFIEKQTLLVGIIFSILALLIIIKHFKNYKRLFLGTENSFKKKK